MKNIHTKKILKDLGQIIFRLRGPLFEESLARRKNNRPKREASGLDLSVVTNFEVTINY